MFKDKDNNLWPKLMSLQNQCYKEIKGHINIVNSDGEYKSAKDGKPGQIHLPLQRWALN